MFFAKRSPFFRPKIGLLVGMGPGSTGPFYDAIISCAKRILHAKEDQDFPEIVMISLPTPFKVSGPMNHQLMKEQLLYGIGQLEALNVDLIAMPCNIIHQYFDELGLNESYKTPVLNIVDITLASLELGHDDKVAVLCAEKTLESRIYHQGLERKGHVIFELPGFQSLVNNLLSELKLNGLSGFAKNLWSEMLDILTGNGCTHAVIACTDISQCLAFLSPDNVTFYDSLGLLANEVVVKYRSLACKLAKDELSAAPAYQGSNSRFDLDK